MSVLSCPTAFTSCNPAILAAAEVESGKSVLQSSKVRSTSRHDYLERGSRYNSLRSTVRDHSDGGVAAVAPAYVRCSQSADATEHNQPHTPEDAENTRPRHLSRARLGLGGRGWQKLNHRLCFETQVSQEGMTSAGNLANHGLRTPQHLTVHNHRRRRDW